MSPLEAAKLLEVAPDANPEQIEARFHELRTKLEEKIGKAPTPGLKAKYRESLEEITHAFETLTLAADASALPVLQRQKTEDGGRTTEGGGAKPAPTATPVAASRSVPTRKSGSKEFVIVAIIAVALLAVGGWWVMKTKAENEEKARIAAEAAAMAKAEAERLAVEKQRAEAAEKARLAAEQDRLDKLSAATRSRIAELRISWEALEQEARALERKTSDLKAEERSLVNNLKGGTSPDLLQTQAELAAHVELSDWLHQQLLRHPAKVARVQGEELLSAKQVDEAVTTIDRAAEEQFRLENEFAANRKSMLTLTGEVSIKPGIQVADGCLRSRPHRRGRVEITDPADRSAARRLHARQLQEPHAERRRAAQPDPDPRSRLRPGQGHHRIAPRRSRDLAGGFPTGRHTAPRS